MKYGQKWLRINFHCGPLKNMNGCSVVFKNNCFEKVVKVFIKMMAMLKTVTMMIIMIIVVVIVIITKKVVTIFNI